MPFEFRATGGQYFRIWIVNLLLTILTLGIYSAWAKVRRLRYLYGSTSLAGSAFEYHGQPLQILKGRVIAFVVFALYAVLTNIWPLTIFIFLPVLLFVVPWVVVLSRRFHMRMSSWRNIRFGFHGQYGGALAAYVGWAVLAAVTLYILVPLWLYKRVQYLLSNTSLGDHRFEFTTGIGRYFAFYYLTIGLAIASFIGFAMIAGGMATAQGGGGNAPSMVGVGLVAVLTIVGFIAITLALGAFWERSFTNAAYDGLGIGPHRIRCQVRMGRLLWLYATNVLGILLTLGLFYPWALIRRLRYQLECMSVETAGPLEKLAAAEGAQASATGEAVGEFFDVDLGM